MFPGDNTTKRNANGIRDQADMHAAIQGMKRAKLLEEIEEMCARAKEMAKTESHLGTVMALHSRCMRLVQPRARPNNEMERARKRESYHRRRKEMLGSRAPGLV